MDTIRAILYIIVGIGMLVGLFLLYRPNNGEYIKAFAVYLAVFLSVILILAYVIVAIFFIAHGAILLSG